MDEIVLRILQEAKRKGLDQKDLALQIDIRPQAITEWKNGTTSSYTKRLPKIAAVLDTTVEYLLTGQKEKPTPLWGSGLSNEALEVAAAYDRAAKKDQDTVRFILADCLPRPLVAREGDGVAPTEEEMSGVMVVGEDPVLP